MTQKYYIQIYRHNLFTPEEHLYIDINSLEFHPELIKKFVDLGILEIKGNLVSAEQVYRLRKILKLRHRLGVNLTGACIIQDLLERVEELEREIQRLRR